MASPKLERQDYFYHNHFAFCLWFVVPNWINLISNCFKYSTMKWTKIDPNNPPIDTVIATDFEDCPAIGVIKIKKGKAFCEVPYKDHENDCFYLEPVTHFIAMHQFEHEVGEGEI